MASLEDYSVRNLTDDGTEPAFEWMDTPEGAAMDIAPCWSADDQEIYFSSLGGTTQSLCSVPAGGGDVRPLLTLERANSITSIRLCGGDIFYNAEKQGIYRLDETDDTRMVYAAPDPGQSDIRMLSTSSDGRYLPLYMYG